MYQDLTLYACSTKCRQQPQANIIKHVCTSAGKSRIDENILHQFNELELNLYNQPNKPDLSTKMPACTAWTMLRKLGFSSLWRRVRPLCRVKVEASQSRTSDGTESDWMSLRSSSASISLLQWEIHWQKLKTTAYQCKALVTSCHIWLQQERGRTNMKYKSMQSEEPVPNTILSELDNILLIN